MKPRLRCLAPVLASALLSASTLVACSGDDPHSGLPAPARATAPPERRIVDVAWDTVFSIGGEIQDTVLLQPRLLTATGPNLYAYDYGDSRLKAFDDRGALRWTFGRSGGGPGEFGNPLDLQVAADGTLWLADHANGRLTVVSDDGELVRHIPYRSGVPFGSVVPVQDGALGLAIAPGDTLWVRVDMDGQVIGTRPMPLPELRHVDPMMRQSLTYVAADSRWVTIYYSGDLFLLHRGLELACSGSLVEGAPFPRPEPRVLPPLWAASVAMSGSSIYVLARGETEQALRIIDEYSADDCSYRQSLRLPARAIAIAASERYLFVASDDPAPRIVGLRLPASR